MPDQPQQTRSDEDLIKEAAGGQREALGELVARYQAPVFRLASYITHDLAAAEDVLQDTFLAVTRNASAYRGEGSVKAWLFSIARHAAWKAGRKAALVTPLEEIAMEQLGRAAGWGEPNAEAVAVANEARIAMRAAFETLSADDQEILVLRDLEGLGNDEAAKVLGIEVAAIKSRIHRARLRLQAACRAKERNHDQA